MIASFFRAPHARESRREPRLKPAEIDIRSLAPRVRTALEAVSVLAPNEHTLRSVELMAALAQLQADDDVLLAALLVPLRQGGLIEEPRALDTLR